MKRKLLTMMLIFGSIFSLVAQKSFTDLLSMDQKKDKDVYVWEIDKVDKNGQGFKPDIAKVNIKKVALVSFTIFAPESWTKYSSTLSSLSKSGTSYFANKLYENAIPILKETFKNTGIELLTIDEFTDEQKNVLNNFGGNKWLELKTEQSGLYQSQKFDFSGVEKKSISIGAAADGYRTINYKFKYPTVKWSNDPLAILAEALGVDAVLIVNNSLEPLKSVLHKQLVISMVGRNPDWKPNQKMQNLYCYGSCFGHAGRDIPNDGIAIAQMKKGDLVSEDYTDYNTYVGFVAKKMLDYYVKRREELK